MVLLQHSHFPEMPDAVERSCMKRPIIESHHIAEHCAPGVKFGKETVDLIQDQMMAHGNRRIEGD
jgi:hypothetical protein